MPVSIIGESGRLNSRFSLNGDEVGVDIRLFVVIVLRGTHTIRSLLLRQSLR